MILGQQPLEHAMQGFWSWFIDKFMGGTPRGKRAWIPGNRWWT